MDFIRYMNLRRHITTFLLLEPWLNAKCAEELAQVVENHLKIRTDPDPDLGNSYVSQGIYYTTNCIEFYLRLTFNL